MAVILIFETQIVFADGNGPGISAGPGVVYVESSVTASEAFQEHTNMLSGVAVVESQETAEQAADAASRQAVGPAPTSASPASAVSQPSSTGVVQMASVMNHSAAVVYNSVSGNEDSSLGLGGAKITMMKGNEFGQQLCIVIEASDGGLIVVDGGIKSNAPYLGKYIRSHGGKVDAWLLTHPHVDHAGALAVLLEKRMNGSNPGDYADIDIREIYHGFAPLDFYKSAEEAYRIPFIEEIYTDLAAFDQERIHACLPAGTSFNVGNVNIFVMNQPYQMSVDAGNNTTIAYMITINGKRLLITGDMPYEGATELLRTYGPEGLHADVVQMAHHGQHGCSFDFYNAVHPSYVLWPTHRELWDRVNDSFDPGQEVYTIALTKYWMDLIGVQKHFIMADGDWVLK